MGGARALKVRAAIEASEVVYTCPMVLAEVRSKVGRSLGATEAQHRVEQILEHAVVIDHTPEIGIDAGRIHHEMRARIDDFGMADAFILAAARSKGVRVLTGDPHFRGVEDADLL